MSLLMLLSFLHCVGSFPPCVVVLAQGAEFNTSGLQVSAAVLHMSTFLWLPRDLLTGLHLRLLLVLLRAVGSEPALLNFGALAELHVFMGDPGAAREVLSAGLASRRPTSRFLRTAALLERRLGNATAAAQLLGRAVARAPRDYRSWLAVSGLDAGLLAVLLGDV
jgi:hypothetical protein